MESSDKGKEKAYLEKLEARVTELEASLRRAANVPAGPANNTMAWAEEQLAQASSATCENRTETTLSGAANFITTASHNERRHEPIYCEPEVRVPGPATISGGYERKRAALREKLFRMLPEQNVRKLNLEANRDPFTSSVFIQLPPKFQLQSMFEVAFTEANHVLPLFDVSVLRDLVEQHYSDPTVPPGKQPGRWAMLNAAIAVAIQLRTARGSYSEMTELSWHFFKNSFSMYSVIALRAADVLGLEALLAMAIWPSGLEFCNAALLQGHTLTLYVRNPAKLPNEIRNSANVSVVKGTLEDIASFQRTATSGPTVFVSFAGPVSKSKGTPVTNAMKRIFPILIESHYERAMVLGTCSYPAPQDKGSLKWKASVILIKIIGGSAYDEFRDLGEFVASQDASQLKCTLFRVPFLTNGPNAPVTASYTGTGDDDFEGLQNCAHIVLTEIQQRLCRVGHMVDHAKHLPDEAIGELLVEGPILLDRYIGGGPDVATFVTPTWLLKGCGDFQDAKDDSSRQATWSSIGGERVELAEVEYHVRRFLPGRAGVAAEMITSIARVKPILAAFIAIGDEVNLHLGASLQPLTVGINEKLAQYVPRTFISEVYIPVETIQLAAAGKTDRKALRKMGGPTTLDEISRLQESRLKNQSESELDMCFPVWLSSMT
ncbi:hypothetical protein KXV32_005900 [Aspergillus fumigatus]|nr:hypothetical protein KXV32_005900 [Aspergillus fumigatus]